MMARSLVSLPFLVHDGIISFLDDFKDRLNLSTTCQHFRALFGARLFSSITLRNSVKSGASIAAVTANYAPCVKEFRFIVTEPDHLQGDSLRAREPEESSEEEAIPKGVLSILSNLSIFPNLEKTVVDFIKLVPNYGLYLMRTPNGVRKV